MYTVGLVLSSIMRPGDEPVTFSRLSTCSHACLPTRPNLTMCTPPTLPNTARGVKILLGPGANEKKLICY